MKVPRKAWLPGARWFCERDYAHAHKPNFYFVIVGPDDEKRPLHKKCRIEIPDSELIRVGYEPTDEWKQRFSHGRESTYSHKHLKKYARWEPAAE